MAPKPNGKAESSAVKDRAIVEAARAHFMQDGFAGASMDGIARSAGVSVKTIYHHFANKDELFSKVMIAACTDHLLSGDLPPKQELERRFSWFKKLTVQGVFEAGREYLSHLLSKDQLSLYRVVTRDADRFPELGTRYQQSFARGRTNILVAFFENMAQKNGWPLQEARSNASLFEALLRAGLYEEVLHGIAIADDTTIRNQARSASKRIWAMMTQSEKAFRA